MDGAGWRRPPAAPHPGWAPVAVVAVLLAAYNLFGNQLRPSWSYVLANVLAGALLVGLARRYGLGWEGMGLRRDRVGGGVVAGLAAGAVVVAGIVVLALVPASREYLADDRFAGQPVVEAAYHMLLRIPIGTAVFEELAFRGVLLGLLLQRLSPLRAVVWSSAGFGLWHVLPTLDALETNPVGDLAESGPAVFAAVAGAAGVTFLAGLAFSWLRLRAGSLVAPVVAHAAINSAAYLAGYVVVRNSIA